MIPFAPAMIARFLLDRCLGILALFGLSLLGVYISRVPAQEAQPPGGELVVFAAASLTQPLSEVGVRLEALYAGLQVLYNFGGSQALRTQLEQGARADVFAAADTVQMELAKKSGLVRDETPIFVKNKLIVIVARAYQGACTAFRDLALPGLQLDLAAPAVPAGHYSRQAIRQAGVEYGADFVRQVLGNVVSEEENVKQVVAKVQLGEADAGIVYVSDVTPQVRHAVRTVPIPDAYNQIAHYPIALTTGARNRVGGEAFLNFVRSEAGQAIFKAHNFIPVKE